MEFLVGRTSSRGDDISPVKKAQRIYVTYIDKRTVKTIEEARSRHWFDSWYNRGVNHREEDGIIACDSKEKSAEWSIDIESIDDLLELVKEHGDIIIKKSSYVETPFEIEIYDDYRE